MTRFDTRFGKLLITSLFAFASSTHAEDRTAATQTGVRDFDFEYGQWRVHHRLKRPGQPWIEFDGICKAWPLLGGAGIVEDHQFDRPTGVTRGAALRTFDAATNSWAIWWVDSRTPHAPLDPPMIGRFENGVGTFYADGIVDGKTIRTRFIWSHITPTSARWEQALSSDAGKTWEVNWVMDFQRTSSTAP